MKKLEEKGGDEAIKLFKKAVDNVKPVLEVKTRRVGGANYQVPGRSERRPSHFAGIRWILTYSRGRGEKGMMDKLANELLDAANNRGARDQEEGRRTSHGRSQQGLRPLSLVED